MVPKHCSPLLSPGANRARERGDSFVAGWSMAPPEPVPILEEEGFATDPDPATIWPNLRLADDHEDEGLGIRQLIDRAELRRFRGQRSPSRRRKRYSAN